MLLLRLLCRLLQLRLYLVKDLLRHRLLREHLLLLRLQLLHLHLHLLQLHGQSPSARLQFCRRQRWWSFDSVRHNHHWWHRRRCWHCHWWHHCHW